MEIDVKNLMIALALSAAFSGPAAADVLREAAEATVKCQSESDAQKRLECLEAATQKLQSALSQAPATEAAAPATPEAVQAPSRTAATSSAPARQAPEGAESVPTWAKAPDRPEKGPDGKAEPEELEVTVVKATESFGRYTFTTSDGQIWKQTQKDRVRLPKDFPVSAKIKRRLTGNPTIQFPNVSRAYRVERIR